MNQNEKHILRTGILLLVLFAVWTVLVQTIDVQCAGEAGTEVGFSVLNCWFHQLTGVHMLIYTITDWLGLVPVFVCMAFGTIGFHQLLRRKSILKVDLDIILLGFYYLLVIAAYLIFEAIPINYRPVLIEGRMEASYPSSTTLLVLSVMPTLVFQARCRLRMVKIRNTISTLSIIFSVFMVGGRLISGVHWFTDIIGSVLLSAGLFCAYKAVALQYFKEK